MEYLLLALGVVTAGLLLLYRHQCTLRDRAEMMRSAIRHHDFSFRLPTKGLWFGERALQEALNDTGQQISKLSSVREVEAWQKLSRVLTHEIMNATAPIQSICQAYLSSTTIKGTPYEEGIQTIHDTSKALATFVTNYRKISQLEEPRIGPLPLLDFCQSVASLYPDIQWHIEVPGDLELKADENLLRMVFINLVKNAQEAGATAIGIRHIVPERYDRHKNQKLGTLQISNNGSTISDEVAREIFVPFFTTKRQGSGIGLSLARQVLMQQGLTLTLRQHPITGYNVTFEIEA